jgi:hypothetical protein
MRKTKIAHSKNNHLPLSFVLFTLLFLIVGVLFAGFFLFNDKGPSSKAALRTCTVSGQVLDLAGETPLKCPTQGGFPGDHYRGMNNLKVHLVGNGLNLTTVSQIGGSGQEGAFYFQNVPTGVYNVCTDTPAPYVHYCNVPRADGISPMGTSCAKIDTAVTCSGVRLDLSYKSSGPTPTPVSPTPTPHVPTPTVHWISPTPTVHWMSPTPTPYKPTLTPTPTRKPTPTPTY